MHPPRNLKSARRRRQQVRRERTLEPQKTDRFELHWDLIAFVSFGLSGLATLVSCDARSDTVTVKCGPIGRSAALLFSVPEWSTTRRMLRSRTSIVHKDLQYKESLSYANVTTRYALVVTASIIMISRAQETPLILRPASTLLTGSSTQSIRHSLTKKAFIAYYVNICNRTDIDAGWWTVYL